MTTTVMNHEAFHFTLPAGAAGAPNVGAGAGFPNENEGAGVLEPPKGAAGAGVDPKRLPIIKR